MIFTLNYRFRFSLLRGGRNKSRCCLVCRSQTINSSYATNGNFAFGRSHIFLAFPPLVQTFAVIRWKQAHSVFSATSVCSRGYANSMHCDLDDGTAKVRRHQIFLLPLLFHLQEEEASLFQLWHPEACRNYWLAPL